MRTEIIWAELHAPLFLAGTNLGQKLDPKQRGGVKMEYDEAKRHLYVTYNTKTCRIPETSVLSMVEGEQKQTLKDRIAVGQSHMAERQMLDLPPQQGVIVNAATRMAVDAQVETPMSHVHAGPGHGHTGQEEKVRNKPGPKPRVKP